jgi:hypothetical protein
MRSCLKIPVLLLVAGVVSLQAQEAGRAPEPEKIPPATEPPAVPKADRSKDALDLPVPKGQPQKGLRIPIYSPLGLLMMNFQIGVATWVDDDNISMGDLNVETFKGDGTSEFQIDLPDSVFNIRTKELTSKAHVTVRRSDFEISGNSMTFNTETKVGQFGGGVKMIIFDARAGGSEKGARAVLPSVSVTPTKEEKK